MTVAKRRESVEELYRVIGDVLEVKPAAITEQSSPETIHGWDSLRRIILITALEERYQVKFTLAQLMAINTVADIRAMLEGYGISFDD